MSYQANQPGTSITLDEEVALAQLANLGDPGQVLTVNLAGTGLEYTTPATGGGGNVVTVTDTDNYTPLENDSVILVDCTSSSVGINLPDPVEGKEYSIKKIDNTLNQVVVQTTGPTIDGSVNKVIKYQNTNMLITNNGINWFVL